MDPSFAFCLIPVVIIVGLFIAQVLYNRKRSTLQTGKKTWERLAKAQNLKFTTESDSDADVTILSGPYRGHLLTFRSSPKGDTTYIRISLERQKAVEDKANTKALDELTTIARSYNFSGSLKVEIHGARVSYERHERLDIIENDLEYFRSLFKLLHSLITLYPQVIDLEEEAIPQLQEIGESYENLQPTCLQMLVDICQRTIQRGKEHGVPLVCKRCFVHFNLIPITLPDKGRITYYGCRLCGQSREFLPLENELVAVLNNQEAATWLQDNGQIKVNWLVHRKLFDFDRVEIQQANDEEVERFAVQAGNDTDESRRSRYQEMACIISPECQLSESATRVLDHIFGKVVKKPL